MLTMLQSMSSKHILEISSSIRSLRTRIILSTDIVLAILLFFRSASFA